MTRLRLVLAITALLLVFPATVFADRAPTLPQSIRIAEAWAAAKAPELPNYCAGGKLKIEWVQDLGRNEHDQQSGERAPGWVHITQPTTTPRQFYTPDHQYVWDPTICKIQLLVGLTPAQTCDLVGHGMLHYVVGPDHVGALNEWAKHPPCVIDEPPRMDLYRALLKDQPQAHGPWRISCTRNSRRMRCKASSPNARMIRRYTASIIGARHDYTATDIVPKTTNQNRTP